MVKSRNKTQIYMKLLSVIKPFNCYHVKTVLKIKFIPNL